MDITQANGTKHQTNGKAKVANGTKHDEAIAEQQRKTSFIHAGSKSKHWTHSPVIPPIYLSTTFETLIPGHATYEYSRSSNPTREELQKYLASLESAKFALAFSSGLGALTTSTYLLTSGDHVLCCDDVYGGTHRLFSRCSSRMGIETTFVDGRDYEEWAQKFRPGKTKMIWIETPTNPTMKLIDITKVAASIKKLDPECIIVVDNTFMTPIFQSPLSLGADIVMHSVTKYINGHSDLIMGALITNSSELHDKLRFFQNALGITPSAYDCSQVIRSIRTLEIRVRHQAASCLEVAEYLEKNPYVERVLYPGLKSHPQHELAAEQCTGFGGIVSIYIKELKGDEAVRLVQSVKVFHAAVSLGCVCSFIQIPSLMTHSAVPEADRKKLGIVNNLLRLSIGLEHPGDLIDDLDAAFKKVYEKPTSDSGQ